MELDKYGYIYVSSRGDYYNVPSATYVIDTNTDAVTDKLSLLPNSEMTLSGDSLYVYSTEWSYLTHSNTISYAIYNVKTHRTVTRNFITDGTEKSIKIPYGVAVNPETHEIFVTDAKDYVIPGTLYCFSPDGKKKWSVTAGDIPAHFAFTYKPLK
jgi:DNA-binding beta-propeller fold protein YncE